MKSVKFYIGLMLIVFIGLTGCKDDALVEGNAGQVEEGIPTTVSINFSTTPQKKLSRAEQTPEAEYNVSTIYLFAFNARGEKTGGQAFAVNGMEATGTYRDESFTGTINGFNILTGSRQRLYAIANYNNGDFDLSKEKLDAIDTEAELLELSIATRNQQLLLNHLSFVMEGEEENVTVSINNGQGIITSSDGDEVDIELKRLNAKITFDVTANVDEAINGTLKFVPKSYMVMQVPLNASIVNKNINLSNAEYASMNEESKEEDKAPITLFDEVEDTHCSFTFYMLENYSAPPEKEETGSEGSGLWIDEEAREAKGNDGIESLYALREKENKQEIQETERDPNYPGKTEENVGYKYAPSTATYVVIKGDLSYQRTNGETKATEYVNVSAEYTIHLGETGKASDANNEERVNNYTVARNVHYTYTIKLTGINSYDAEVNDDRKEERPGAEGDVVIAGDQVRAIDSHYARTRIKFTRTALQNGLSWIVQTPFDEGMKVANSNQNSLKDYKWVLFAVNKEFGVEINDHYNRTMVKFPGYEAYDGGASTMGGVQNNANEDEGNSSSNCLKLGTWKERVSTNNYYNSRNLSDDACLRDVNQLINHLREIASVDTKCNDMAEWDSESRQYVVYVTAFIDEYVYIYDPKSQEYTIPDASVDDEDRLILWKQVVNGRDRLMHICTEGAKYSPDGESSWSNSVLTIRQSPIYSIYNELDSGIKSAWGTESILETPALPIKPDGNYSLDHGWNMILTMDNGRYNTLSIFGSRSNNGDYQSRNILWTTVLSRDADDIGIGDTPKEEELQPGYRDVWHACMTRNRDLDGDNIIDPEEIRWVMASIDELTDLWIGESALPETAHLYQGDGTYMEHVVSSSGSYTAPWIIWAEEGASRGQYNDGDVNYKDPITGYRDYKYRCIRYLGIPLDNIEEIPKDYVTVTKVSSVYGDSYRLNLSKLDYSARRSSSDGGYELPLHFERGNDGNNRPYRAFEVLVTPQGEGVTARHWTEDNITGFKDMVNFSNSSKLCPSGYRVPNQRELMLMYTSLNNSQGYNVSWGSGESYWSSTQFSFNGKGLYSANDRPGFATDASNMILTSTTQSAWDNVSGKVRCVRDVTE